MKQFNDEALLDFPEARRASNCLNCDIKSHFVMLKLLYFFVFDNVSLCEGVLGACPSCNVIKC